jgi:hypothetical protein
MQCTVDNVKYFCYTRIMKSLEVISPNDKDVATAIMDEAYNRMLNPPTRLVAFYGGLFTPFEATRRRVCYGASDRVTTVAHELGIYAAREIHNGHGLTSFGHPDELPSQEDPIICLTWGQFISHRDYERTVEKRGIEPRPGYFGKRREIRSIGVDLNAYQSYYAPDTIEYLQVTCSSRPNSGETLGQRKDWLATTVHDIIEGGYPIGEVDRSMYPTDNWI